MKEEVLERQIQMRRRPTKSSRIIYTDVYVMVMGSLSDSILILTSFFDVFVFVFVKYFMEY